MAIAAAGWLLPASAQAPLRELGTLTCSVGGVTDGAAAAAAQGREGLCRFRPGNSGAEEIYLANLQFIGQRAGGGGPAVDGTVMLVVKVPFTTALKPGLLEQTYAADASAGTGKPGPLVGQRNASLVLHPEVDAPGEATLALGRTEVATLMVAELKLKSSPA